ncbi:hypothetical protein BDP27DRAFT_1485515 [Rhodocollybia butyracea]|uniref:Uncharacterized protein n=1 Tax=Rhodocollybia butyracea TaxID=206335 RepID=A0A9P5PA67_9AGAR|nr:hypothetical protein BDP27DRAFT_1485515 [Rhodocollybia butyracea]
MASNPQLLPLLDPPPLSGDAPVSYTPLKGPVNMARKKPELVEIAQAFGWNGNVTSTTKKELLAIIMANLNNVENSDMLQGNPRFQGLISYRTTAGPARISKASGKNSSDKVMEDREAAEAVLDKPPTGAHRKLQDLNIAAHPPAQFKPLNTPKKINTNLQFNEYASDAKSVASSDLTSPESFQDRQGTQSPSKVIPEETLGALTVASESWML